MRIKSIKVFRALTHQSLTIRIECNSVLTPVCHSLPGLPVRLLSGHECTCVYAWCIRIFLADCWQINRTAEGVIVPDPNKFPNFTGMIDYIHSQGLKFGEERDGKRLFGALLMQ